MSGPVPHQDQALRAIHALLTTGVGVMPYDDDDEVDHGICPACNGSGEGQYDGSICRTCRGSGES